ncbi:MAG: hypothetical protein NVS9B15_26110 [Acidobacteriaceae bacterium]
MRPNIVWLTPGARIILLVPGFVDLTVNMLAQIRSGCGLWAIRGIDEPLQILNQMIILAFFIVA